MTLGILVMAYGGPDTLDDVAPFLSRVRGGRPTPARVVDAVRERYRLIGGGSPILARTRAQAAALDATMRRQGCQPVSVRVGMLHWSPSLVETMAVFEAEHVRRIVGLVMAPHYSRLSIGKYEAAIEATETSADVTVVPSWHLLEDYVAALIERIDVALQGFAAEERDDVHLIFTAHSLPERIRTWDDPYPAQLAETVVAVMARLGARPHRVAYQSAAMTREPWLGPDAGEVMVDLARAGHRSHLIVPIGFTSDHVEILYDIDVEYRQLAERHGVHLERIDMLNDSSTLMRGLATLVADTVSARGWM